MRRKDREIMNANELTEIFQKADICRIALVDGEMPYIVAMNYGYSEQDNAIYFHCAKKGRKLDLIAKNHNVCFQADADYELMKSDIACDFSATYKSIVGTGTISVVEDEQERNNGMNAIMKHYSGKDDFSFDEKMFNVTCVLKLKIKEMTGKQIV